MGRKPYGAENVLAALKTITEPGTEIIYPVEELRAKTELSEITVRKYLKELSDSRVIVLHYGGHKGVQIIGCTVCQTVLRPEPMPPRTNSQSTPAKPVIKIYVETKAETVVEPVKKPPPVVIEPAPPKVEVAPTPPPPAPDPRPPDPVIPAPTKTSPIVILLVDYDNATMRAREAQFNLSFARLKEYARKQGRVIFADAFISPHSSRQDQIACLWQAGFQVIVCPMATKDKDAVDQKLSWRARQYITETAADLVLIASADRDFVELKDFARDRHKQVRFIDTAMLRPDLEGSEVAPQLPLSRTLSEFTIAISNMEHKQTPSTPRARQQMEFVQAVISALAIRERDENGRRAAFLYLKNNLWPRLQGRWGKSFTSNDLHSALTSLVNAEVLAKNTTRDMNFYTLNPTHCLVKEVLGTATTAAAVS